MSGLANPGQATFNGAPTAERNGIVVDLDATPKQDTPVGAVELFRLGGQVHTIPEKARFNIALKYLWLAKVDGEVLAGQWLLEELLGPEGYQALMNYDDLTEEQFGTIMTAAQKVVLGSLESGKA